MEKVPKERVIVTEVLLNLIMKYGYTLIYFFKNNFVYFTRLLTNIKLKISFYNEIEFSNFNIKIIGNLRKGRKYI